MFLPHQSTLELHPTFLPHQTTLELHPTFLPRQSTLELPAMAVHNGGDTAPQSTLPGSESQVPDGPRGGPDETKKMEFLHRVHQQEDGYGRWGTFYQGQLQQ